MRNATIDLIAGFADELRAAAQADRPLTVPADTAGVLQLAFEGAAASVREMERRLKESELARAALAAELQARTEREFRQVDVNVNASGSLPANVVRLGGRPRVVPITTPGGSPCGR